MQIQRKITSFIALSLAILILAATSPISAAEIAAPAHIGSVSAVGSVQLRGVGVSEGTLFSGDRLNVAPGAYATVVLGAGPKVEVGGSSDVTVSKDANAINIQMTSGNIAFTGNAQKPVRVRLGVYEITTTSQARGSVVFVGSEAFRVRTIDGTVSVRNTSTKQSFTVTKGSERLISLRGDSSQPGGVLLASSGPTAIPPAPAMPARQLSGGKMKALSIVAVLGSAAAIAVLMTKNDDTDKDAADRLVKAQALELAAALKVTTSAIVSVSSSVTAELAATNAAIAASTLSAADKTTLANQAAAAEKALRDAAAAAALIQSQINALTAQITGAPTSAQQTQLANLNSGLESERDKANDAISKYNDIRLRFNLSIHKVVAATNNASASGG